MYFCPQCSYSFDVKKAMSSNSDKEEVSSLSILLKKLKNKDDISNIKLTINKNTLLSDDKFKKLKENTRNKVLSLYDSSNNKVIFNCLNCNFKSNIDKTIKLYHLDLQVENQNVLSVEDCKILSKDPILPRTKDYNCKNINCISHKNKANKEAIFFKDKSTYKLNYVCTICYTNWTL